MRDLQAGDIKERSGSGKKMWIIIAVAIPAGLVLIMAISVIALTWVNPSFTSFTLQEDWESLNIERYSLSEHWVPAEDLPDHLKLAAIASEDQRFMDHYGIDLSAIMKAIEERRDGESQRGASTITQQVAKNLYLWRGQSIVRKMLEAGIAVMIDLFWTKDRIMEMYLNIAEFGPGLFGAGIATAEWYGKTPAGLEPVESARMIAVLPNPKWMRVEPPSPFAEERSIWILRQMTRISGISYISGDPNESNTGSADSTSSHSGNGDQINREADLVIRSSDTVAREPDSTAQ